MKRSLLLLLPCLVLVVAPGDAGTAQGSSLDSSAEAEVIRACSPGSAELLAAKNMLQELGYNFTIRLYTDSSA